MDAPALTPDEGRELAALRRRAYGPDADILRDPDALARLEELESSVRAPSRRHEPVRDPKRPGEETHTARSEPDDAPDAVGGNADDPPEDDAAPTAGTARSRRLRARPTKRRGWVAIAAALVLVVAVAWTATTIAGPRSDATLSTVPADAETGVHVIRQGFFGSFELRPDSIVQYEDYRELTVWSASAQDGSTCLVIDEGSPSPNRIGIVGASCTPAGLDPSADVTVWHGRPDGLLDELPAGTVIRFTLSGDRVHVWERSPQRST